MGLFVAGMLRLHRASVSAAVVEQTKFNSRRCNSIFVSAKTLSLRRLVLPKSGILRFCFGLLFLALLAPRIVLCQEKATSLPDGGGATLYLQNCAKCHGTLGEGINGIISIAGPSLRAEHDRQSVVNIVRKGQGMMPSFDRLLSQQQIDAVTSYVTQQLANIPLRGGDLGQGGTLFRVYCAPCHGTAARGGALAFAGVNAPSLVGKSVATVAGAIRWGPGQMPAFPATAISDEQLNSIVAYVQFMQNPPSPGGTPMKYYGPVAEGFVAWVALLLLVVAAGWIERGRKG